MRKKALAVTLIAVGVVLAPLSGLGLALVFTQISDYRYFFARSGSMEPTIGRGECVKIKLGVPIDEIYAAPKPDGDIIAFTMFPVEVIVHRAVGSGTDTSYYLVTRGDANPGPDGWRVRQANLIGRVVEINPPFWMYNYVFWGVLFVIGVTTLCIGIILKWRSQESLARPDRDYVI